MEEPWMETGAEFQALLQDLALKTGSTTSASLSPSSHHDGLFDDSDWLNWQADTSIIPEGDVNVANFLSFGLEGGTIAAQHSPNTAESDVPAFVPGSVTGAADAQAQRDDEGEESAIEDITVEEIDNILAPHSLAGTVAGDSPESVESAIKKRKLSDATSISDELDNGKTATRRKPQKSYDENGKPQKVSHNIIEKRYRSNLNAQITELRDCVPILRAEVARNPSAKHNKGRIISGASAYIQELEQRNRRMQSEKERVEARLSALERRLQHVRDRHNKKGRATKLVVGGLAGMAAMSGWQQADGEVHSTHALGALPLPVLRWLRSPVVADALPTVALFFKALLILGAFIVILTWPDSSDQSPKTAVASASTSDDRDRQEITSAEKKLGITSRSSLRLVVSELVGATLRMLGMASLPAEARAAYTTIAEAQVTGRCPALSSIKLLTPAIALAGQPISQELRALQLVLLLSGWLDGGIVRSIIGWSWSNGRAKKRGQDTPFPRLFSNEAMSIVRKFSRARLICSESEVRALGHAQTAIELLDAVAVELALRSARQDAFDESKNLSIPLTTVKRALPLLPPSSVAHFDALLFAATLGDNKKQLEAVLNAAQTCKELDAHQSLQLLSVVAAAKLKSGKSGEAKAALELIPYVPKLNQSSCLALYMVAERCCSTSLDKDEAVASRLHKFYGAIRRSVLSPDVTLDESVRDKLANRCIQRVVRLLRWDDDSGYESR